MTFVKNLNGKAVETAYEEGAAPVPENGYIAAMVMNNEIYFYGASDEDGVIPIGSTANGSQVTTYAEAKTAIETLGVLFLNGVAI